MVRKCYGSIVAHLLTMLTSMTKYSESTKTSDYLDSGLSFLQYNPPFSKNFGLNSFSRINDVQRFHELKLRPPCIQIYSTRVLFRNSIRSQDKNGVDSDAHDEERQQNPLVRDSDPRSSSQWLACVEPFLKLRMTLSRSINNKSVALLSDESKVFEPCLEMKLQVD